MRPDKRSDGDGNGLSAQRVRYLERAFDLIRARLLPEAPPRAEVALAYSFPTTGAAHDAGATIGQCIYSPLEGSAAKERMLIVIHPSQWTADLDVLAVLAHEMAHAATPGAGHTGAFVQLIRRMGLDGRPRATVPGSPFKRAVDRLRPELPSFPAGSLTITRKVQGTRNRLWECACSPPIKVRSARDSLPWVCTVCGQSPTVKRIATGARYQTEVLGRSADQDRAGAAPDPEGSDRAGAAPDGLAAGIPVHGLADEAPTQLTRPATIGQPAHRDAPRFACQAGGETPAPPNLRLGRKKKEAEEEEDEAKKDTTSTNPDGEV